MNIKKNSFDRTISSKIFAAVVLCGCLLLGYPAANGQTARQAKLTSVFTPLYNVSSKSCKTDEAYLSEGDDYGKVCAGSGKYKLLISGFGTQINYGIGVPKTDFSVYFFPLATGAAAKFERADLYKEKLVGQIEWRLADGVTFAAIVRAEFYKNTGAKTAVNPKNKAGEFVFVRGLKGFEDLKEDLDAIQTAFNVQEQAHKIADEFYEQKKK